MPPSPVRGPAPALRAPRRLAGSSLAASAAVAASALVAAAPAGAQQVEPRCAAEALLQDACQTAADVFTLLTPQLGAVVAGGSATLGQGGVTGGFGRFALALRATGMRADVPDLEASPPALGAARQRTIPANGQWVALPQLDLSVGIYRGLPLGRSNVGGLDVLFSGAWLPDVSHGGLTVHTPGSGFRAGVGARLVLHQETADMPGLAVTWMRRGVPTAHVTARLDGGEDTVRVERMRVSTDSWRVMASKNFYSLGLALGIGQDGYSSAGDLTLAVRDGEVEARTASPIPYRREVTRTNAFADLSFAFGGGRLVFEGGRVWGGSAATFNDFGGVTATEPRFYGSVGLRAGF